MSIIQISDLSFCEEASITQVQGGLSINTKSTLDFPSLLKRYIPALPELEKYSSEQQGEYTVDKFRDQTGDTYAYQAVSKDGTKQLGAAIGKKDNLNFVTSFASKSTSS